MGVLDETIIASFSTAWFGSATPPDGFLIGAYGGAGVGLSNGGDAVNLFDASGNRITGVSFGAATANATFDNAAGLGSATLPLPAVSTLSVAGVNGAFLASNGAETGSPGRRANPPSVSAVDLSIYVRIGRFDLPEPTRTAAPANSVLAQEVSAVTYNWDTDTLFVVGDGGTSIVQVSKTGQLIDSMTLAAGEQSARHGLLRSGRPDLCRRRQVRHGRGAGSAGRPVHLRGGHHADQSRRTDRQARHVCAQHRDRGHLVRPADGRIHRGQGDGAARHLPNRASISRPGPRPTGRPTTENSIDLFDPALANLLDFADVFALSNLPSLSGPDSSHLLVLSQESGKIVNIDRNGNISSSLTIVNDPGNPLSVRGPAA